MTDTCRVSGCKRPAEYELVTTPGRDRNALGAKLCTVHYVIESHLMFLPDGTIIVPEWAQEAPR